MCSSALVFRSLKELATGENVRLKRSTAEAAAAHGKRLVVAKAERSSGGQLGTSSGQGQEEGGTVPGAVSLIIGTGIGTGILALPEKTSSVGFIPSAASLVVCWAFLTVEALLLAEVNVWLMRKNKQRSRNECAEGAGGRGGGSRGAISLRTMAQETLGEWGGNVAAITYVFLAYTSTVAYASKSGDVLSHLIGLPSPLSGILFTVTIAALVLIGGAYVTDQVNQWLTASMIGVLVAIEVVGVSSGGGWTGLTAIADWGEVPPTIPVIIFSLVYHDITPVICWSLRGDLGRIRLSLMLGSLVPLLCLLVWDAIALGLSSHPLDLLTMGSGTSTWKVEVGDVFALLAVGTSLIGTLLGFSHFFREQLGNLLALPSSPSQLAVKGDPAMCVEIRDGGRRFTATAMAVIPPLLVSTTVPDAFSAATEFAGGYCMTVLYGVLPPLMAWAIHDDGGGRRRTEDHHEGDGHPPRGLIHLDGSKPVLIGVGLFACALIAEQVLQDLPPLKLF